MGKSDDDLADIQDAPTKTVTVRSFYMDEQKSPTVSTESL
jgi:formylglycine-generating enzyme required for sulfatase activity